MEIHNECFASTKKGMRRKTVSSRRAYVDTPSTRRKAIKLLNSAIKKDSEGRSDGKWGDIIDARDILANQKMGESGYKLYPLGF